MRGELYARCSSENQREQSITDQCRACEEYVARQNGWAITDHYKDEGISGSQDRQRRWNGYRQMLDNRRCERELLV